MSDKRYTLLYDGQEIQLGERDPGVFDGYDGQPGVLRLDLGDDVFLTLAVGPGIPLAVYESPHHTQF